jgi:hypothetical protein
LKTLSIDISTPAKVGKSFLKDIQKMDKVNLRVRHLSVQSAQKIQGKDFELLLLHRKIKLLEISFMQVTTFQGVIENGRVKFETDVRLPEKTKVYVVVPEFEQTATGKKFDLAEMVSRMPADYEPSEENFGSPVGKEEW